MRVVLRPNVGKHCTRRNPILVQHVMESHFSHQIWTLEQRRNGNTCAFSRLVGSILPPHSQLIRHSVERGNVFPRLGGILDELAVLPVDQTGRGRGRFCFWPHFRCIGAKGDFFLPAIHLIFPSFSLLCQAHVCFPLSLMYSRSFSGARRGVLTSHCGRRD